MNFFRESIKFNCNAIFRVFIMSCMVSSGQTTVRYQKVIQGGTAMIGSAHCLKSTNFRGTSISSSSDLTDPVSGRTNDALSPTIGCALDNKNNN